jgi:hypothetical protein
MSWETVVSGGIVFKEGTSKEEREKIIKQVKNTLELPPKEEHKYGAYGERTEADAFYFTHVNWFSHVDEEVIQNLINEIKDKVKSCDFNLYYLDYGKCWILEEETKELKVWNIGL